MVEPVVKTLELACDAAHAFEVFTTRTATWWPLDSHTVSAGADKVARGVTIEPRLGGAVYETTHDGARSDWGEVLAFEPGVRLAMSWHPGSDPGTATRVEVVFTDLPGAGARVVLTHSGWEVWAEQAAELRGNYEVGWGAVFADRYAGACA